MKGIFRRLASAKSAAGRSEELPVAPGAPCQQFGADHCAGCPLGDQDMVPTDQRDAWLQTAGATALHIMSDPQGFIPQHWLLTAQSPEAIAPATAAIDCVRRHLGGTALPPELYAVLYNEGTNPRSYYV